MISVELHMVVFQWHYDSNNKNKNKKLIEKGEGGVDTLNRDQGWGKGWTSQLQSEGGGLSTWVDMLIRQSLCRR